MHLFAGAATDVGLVRANNQDQLLLASPIFAVADGMGGHAAGEVASLTAVNALQAAFEQGLPSAEGVVAATRAANRAVWDAGESHAELHGMGTTLTAVALVPAGEGAGRDAGEGAGREDAGAGRAPGPSAGQEVAVVNVGDSRTYRFHAGELAQLTADHSYVAELVAEGQINEAQAEVHPQRHVLTRALGVSPDVDVDLLVLAPVPGDRYLLCSDGLSREVSDEQVASILRRLADPGDAARELVSAAKLHGGSDNVTVVVVDVVADADEPPAPPSEEHTTAVPAVAAAAAEEHTAAVPTVAAAAAEEQTTAVPAVAGAAAGTGHTTAVPAAPPDDPTRTGNAAGVAAGGPAGGRDRSARRRERRAAHAAAGPRARLVTIRVVAFFVLLLAILAIAAFGTEYYARSAYYVGLQAGRVTIFQGRPGGVLWWKPTVSEVTPLAASGVLAYHLPALRDGVQESTLGAARAYVSSLRAEKASSEGGTSSTTVAP